jgi:hypothetical protein
MSVVVKRGACALGVLAGCFAPSPPEGLPCGPAPERACPTGQVCDDDGRCRLTIEPADARLPDAPLPVIDAPPGTPDAPPADAPFVWTITRIDELRSDTGDQDPSMTADGLTIVFSSSRDGGDSDLFVATRGSIDAPWSPPIQILELSSPEQELSPEIAPDGLSIYFISSALAGNYNVFAAYRAAPSDAFGAPVLQAGLSTGEGEYGVGRLGETLAIVARGGNGDDFYLAERASAAEPWPAGTPIGELNTTDHGEASPYLTEDRLVLYFHRRDAGGSFQMFRTTRATPASPWGPPVQIFADNDSDPWASSDEKTILFTRQSDLYMATRP